MGGRLNWRVTERGEKTFNGKLIFEVHRPGTHLLIAYLAPLRRGFFLPGFGLRCLCPADGSTENLLTRRLRPAGKREQRAGGCCAVHGEWRYHRFLVGVVLDQGEASCPPGTRLTSLTRVMSPNSPQKAAYGIEGHGALAHQEIAATVYGQDALLFGALNRHKAHGGSGDGFANGFGIGSIVLAALRPGKRRHVDLALDRAQEENHACNRRPAGSDRPVRDHRHRMQPPP
jgi:hypothetical protein